MDSFALLEFEPNSSDEKKRRVFLGLEYGAPSYTVNSLSFPLRYTESYSYIRGNLQQVHLMSKYVYRLQDALITTEKYIEDLLWDKNLKDEDKDFYCKYKVY